MYLYASAESRLGPPYLSLLCFALSCPILSACQAASLLALPLPTTGLAFLACQRSHTAASLRTMLHRLPHETFPLTLPFLPTIFLYPPYFPHPSSRGVTWDASREPAAVRREPVELRQATGRIKAVQVWLWSRTCLAGQATGAPARLDGGGNPSRGRPAIRSNLSGARLSHLFRIVSVQSVSHG